MQSHHQILPQSQSSLISSSQNYEPHQTGVSSQQLPANYSIVPGIPARNTYPPRHPPRRQQQYGEYQIIRRRIYPLNRVKKVEIFAWLAIALNNLGLYVYYLVNLDKFVLAAFLSVVLMMSFSLSQPSMSFTIYRRRQCIGLKISLTIILIGVSGYLAFEGYNFQLHSEYLSESNGQLRWMLASALICLAFAISVAVKNILGACNTTPNVIKFLIILAISTFLLNLVESFIAKRLRDISIAGQVLKCVVAFYIGVFLLSGKAYVVGSNTHRMISKIVVIILIFGMFMIEIIDDSAWVLGQPVLKASWLLALWMGFQVLFAFEDIEEEMRNEGERVYNNRISHDQYTA